MKGAQQEFCTLWPQIKSGLSLLRNVLAGYPQVGVFAVPLISIVQAAGDEAVKHLCPASV